MEEAIEILRLYDEQCDDKIPHMHIVFGSYDGPIDAKEGEHVIFIGDCAEWKGEIAGKTISVESLYRDRATKDPHHAKHDDIYKKMLSVTQKLGKAKNATHLRLEGCPVSVAEQVLALVGLSDIKNPYLAPDEVMRFNKGYLMWRSVTAANRLRGKPYQKNGTFTERGQAAPTVSTDPAE